MDLSGSCLMWGTNLAFAWRDRGVMKHFSWGSRCPGRDMNWAHEEALLLTGLHACNSRPNLTPNSVRTCPVGILTCWKSRIRLPERVLSSAQCPYQVWAHPTPRQMVPDALCPGLRSQGRETDHSTLPSAEVKKGGAIPPRPHISS
jgi:hypothetical protein